MCDHGTQTICLDQLGLDSSDQASLGLLSRRGALRGGAALLAASLLTMQGTRSRGAGIATRPQGLMLPGGLSARLHAMHVHSVGGEGSGSSENQFALAAACCQYYWPTEHDWRTFALPSDGRLRRQFVFNTLNYNDFWWSPVSSKGAYVSRFAGIVTYNGAQMLNLQIQSGTNSATYGLQATTKGNQVEGPINGRQFGTPVTFKDLSGDSYYEIVVQLSRHGSGFLKIVYRFGTTASRFVRVDRLTGHVYVQVKAGQTINPVLTPLDDARTLFPEMDPYDNCLTALNLQVTSKNGSISVMVPKIDMPRNVTGQDALDQLRQMLERTAARYPGVTLRQAIEVSGAANHFNWYGPGATYIERVDTDLFGVVNQIKTNGGVPSYNHPLGTQKVADTASRRIKAYQALWGSLRNGGPYGATMLELGYDPRAGVNLAGYLELGDKLWCSGGVFTPSGVSDDHPGITWEGTFLNALYSDGTPESDLAAMRQGLVSVPRVGVTGDLYCSLDGRPMGSVPGIPSSSSTAELTITATELASTSKVQVVSGRIGTSMLSGAAPITVTDVPASTFKDGVADLSVPGGNYYHRTQIVDSSGTVVHFTGPVWAGVPNPENVPEERFA